MPKNPPMHTGSQDTMSQAESAHFAMIKGHQLGQIGSHLESLVNPGQTESNMVKLGTFWSNIAKFGQDSVLVFLYGSYAVIFLFSSSFNHGAR